MEGAKERLRLVIRGRVQGVWYRASARDRAEALGMTGWVRNLHDGSVELVAEGGGEAVEHLFGWCREGPPLAQVSRVEQERSPATGEFSAFDVK